jgi:hypothetical protein
VQPIAVATTRGAWYRHGSWRSTLDAVDDPANEAAFGRPASSRGPSADPQIRFVSLSKMARTFCSAVAWDPARPADVRPVQEQGRPGVIGVAEPADLDDAAGARRVGKCLDPAQAHVVGAAVGAVDHRVGFAGQFVMQSGGDEAPDDRNDAASASITESAMPRS